MPTASSVDSIVSAASNASIASIARTLGERKPRLSNLNATRVGAL